MFLAVGTLTAGTLFQPTQTYLSGGVTAESIAVADMNHDGNLDLVVGNGSRAVSILLGNGDGTFQPPKTFDPGIAGTSIAVADINGDGNLDVVAGASVSCAPVACPAVISVMLGDGNGNLSHFITYGSSGSGPSNIALADVTGDGKPDLLVTWCTDPACNNDMTLAVFPGNGNGTFATPQNFDLGVRGGGAVFVLADLNRDGKLDAVVTHEGGNIEVLLGKGDGTFRAPLNFNTGGVASYSIQAADLNGDGNVDLFATSYCVSNNDCSTGIVGVLLGNGDGTFQVAKTYPTNATGAQAVTSADINGDGKPDLIVAHRCFGFCNSSPVVVLEGNGDGTFKKPLRYFSGGKSGDAILAVDTNGDAKPDVIVANVCASNSDCSSGNVGVLLGTAGVLTTPSVTSNRNPSTYGEAVTFTVTVQSVGPNTPTGNVRLLNGTVGLGSATLADGVATFMKTNLPAGSLSITAVYNGDLDSAKSTSAPLREQVQEASTTTTIASSSNPSTQGQSVTFTARVTSPTARVTGSVTFKAGTTILGSVALAGGKASLASTTLPVGANRITATYEGTTNIQSSSATLTQIVH
jgi:hypothetical protein